MRSLTFAALFVMPFVCAAERQGPFGEGAPKMEIDGVRRAPDRSETADGVRTWHFGPVTWTWRTRRDGDWTFVASEIANRGARDVKLGRCDILDAQAGVLAGRPGVRFLDLQRLQLRQRTVRAVSDPKAARDIPIHVQFAEPDGSFALQFGFTTFTTLETSCHWSGTGGVARVRASGAFEDWTLKAGAATPFEEFAYAVGRDPHAQLVRWATRVAENYRPQFIRTPPLGLSGSAWTHLAQGGPENADEAKFNKAAALSKLLPGYGFRYSWISNSNIPGGNPGDWKGWNLANHPLGRDGTAKRYADIGWVMGSWAGPFMLSSELTDMTAEFSDALYRNADGTPWVFKTAWSHGDAGRLPRAKRPAIYALDPSVPKVVAKLADDFAYLRAHGVRYYMLDFLQTGLAYGGVGPDAPRFSGADGSRSRVEAFYRAMQTIRAAAGPDTYLLGCSGPTFCCVGTVDGVRTAGDLGEGRNIHPDAFFYPASFAINRIGFWTGPERSLYNTATYYTHGRLFNNDLGNVLTVGEPLPLEHARVSAAIHAFAGASSMFGDDPRDITPERLALVTATFPREGAPAVPEDLFTGEPGEPPSVLRYDFADASVFAVVNMGPSPIRRTLRRRGVFVLFDYFDARMRNRHRDEVAVSVPPESVRIYRLVDCRKTPQVIGTSSAFTGRDAGGAWDAASGTLAVTVRRPRRERGVVYLFAPPGWHLADTRQGRIGKDVNTEELVVAVPFETDNAGVWERRILFERHALKESDVRNEADRFG